MSIFDFLKKKPQTGPKESTFSKIINEGEETGNILNKAEQESRIKHGPVGVRLPTGEDVNVTSTGEDGRMVTPAEKKA